MNRDFGVQVISTGDLLRQAIKDQTPLGQKVQSVIKSGSLFSRFFPLTFSLVLVDDATMIGVVREGLSQHSEFIMDGLVFCEPFSLNLVQGILEILAKPKASINF